MSPSMMRTVRYVLGAALFAFLAIPLSAQTDTSSATILKDLRRFCATTTGKKYSYLCDDTTLAKRLVVAPAPSPSPSPAPSPTPSTGVATVAELPRVVPPSRDPYPAKPCTVTVPSGDANAAIANARGGSVVCLTAGATYAPIRLPVRASGDTGWLVIRSSGALPSEGTRIARSAVLPRIVTPLNGQPALTIAPGASGYVLRGVEFTTAPSVTQTYALVELGDGQSPTLPARLIVAQSYIHGSATGEMQRCVALNAASVAIVDSYLGDCHGKGYDSQAIGGWSGTGPYLIENNTLEGAGENVMLGGAAPAAEGLVASDVTIRRNHILTPIAWKGVWSKKNLLELKTCHRCLVEANVLDGSWTDAQTGFAFVVKSSTDAPFHGMNTDDVTIRANRVTHIGAGFSVTSREGQYPLAYPTERTARVTIEGNYVDSVNVAPFVGAGRMLSTGGVSKGVTDLIVRGNTMLGQNLGQFITLWADPGPAPGIERFDYQSNLVSEGEYGIGGDGAPGFGNAALDYLTTPYTFAHNVLVHTSANSWTYPATTTLVSSPAQAPSGAGADLAAVLSATTGVVIP